MFFLYYRFVLDPSNGGYVEVNRINEFDYSLKPSKVDAIMVCVGIYIHSLTIKKNKELTEE